MGLLDRLLGRRAPQAADARSITGPEAIDRWKYLLRTAPAEPLGVAHVEGLAALSADASAPMLHGLRRALSALEPGTVVPSAPDVLIRAAVRAERTDPGFLERTVAAGPKGQESLGALASAVIATAALAPFLRTYDPELGADGLAARRAQDFDVEGGTHDSDSHDDELADED